MDSACGLKIGFAVGMRRIRERGESEMISRFLTWASLRIMVHLLKWGLTREEIGCEVCKLIIEFEI